MVFTVRCYKCGEHAVRLVLGGRAILHARCHACDANLLAEVLEFEDAIVNGPLPDADEITGETPRPEGLGVPRDEDPTSDVTEEADELLEEMEEMEEKSV